MKRKCRPCSHKLVLSLVSLAIAQYAATAILPGSAIAAPMHSKLVLQQAQLPLSEALLSIARKSGVSVSFDPAVVLGKVAGPQDGLFTVDEALNAVLKDTGLGFTVTEGGAYIVGSSQAKRSEQAAYRDKEQVPLVVVNAERLEKGYAADSSGAATRTNTPLMNLAQAVSTVTKELMDDQQTSNVLESLRNVAGISQSSVPNGPQPSIQIRGFAVDNTASDGLMSTGAMELFTPAIALEKVEVIKGPESIIGGTAAAFGGLINIVSKTPQATSLREFQYGFDNNGKRQIGLDVTGALNETKELRGRMIASAEHGADTDLGWNGGKAYYFAPSLAWKDGGQSLNVGAEVQHYHRPFGNFVYAVGTYLSQDSVAPYHAPDDGFDYKFHRYHFNYQRNLGNEWKMSVRGRYQTTESVGKYWAQSPTELPSVPGTPMLVLANDQSLSYTTKSLQADVTRTFKLGRSEHHVLLGFDYSQSVSNFGLSIKYDTDIYSFYPAGGSEILPSVSTLPNSLQAAPPQRAATEERGIFIQDQISIGEKWHLLLAERFMQYRPKDGSLLPAVSKFIPSAGIVYKPYPATSLYASFSKGIDSTISFRTREGDALPPTQAKQFEIGLKNSYFDERMIVTTSLFRVKKTDVAMADLDNSGFYHTAGGQESRGLEFEINGRLSPALNISAAYTYALSADDFGLPLLGLAKHSLNAWAQYRWRKTADGNWSIGGGINTRSKLQYVLPSTSVSQLNPGNARLDAVLGYDAKDWSVKLGVKNIADRILFSSGSTIGLAEVEPRRTYSLTGSYRF